MIYLDNNATTRPAPNVIEAVAQYLGDEFGNPSSSHIAGRRARAMVDEAREAVAALVGASSASEIIFTSGGTESDNWAIHGSLLFRPEKDHIVTTRVEHEAVRKLCEGLEREGRRVTWVWVDEKGTLDLGQLKASLNDRTAVVSMMMANNETGVLFPIAEIGEIVKQNCEALFHVDGVNAVGKIPIDLKYSLVDLFSMSAHKFHGPKGIGALWVRNGVELPQMLIGGGQESGRRAGTEAVHQIAGMGAAAHFVSDLAPMGTVRELRDRLESEFLKSIPGASVNGDPGNRLPNTTNISFESLNGEMILHMLDEAGICVSTGSACNSDSHGVSAVLAAMNVPFSRSMGSIRFSLGRFNTEEEIDKTLAKTITVVRKLAAVSGIDYAAFSIP